MIFNKIRLKWKVFLFLLGFCALLLAVLWLFQTVFLNFFYQRVKELEIKRDANNIINNINNEDINDFIIKISENNELSIDITDLRGNSLLMPFELQDRHLVDENYMLIERAKNSGGEYRRYNNPPPNAPEPGRMFGRGPAPPRSLMYAKLAVGEPDKQIAVITRAVISPLTTTVTTLRYQLYVISGVMLVLSVGLAIIIAKRVSKPIEKISQSALSLAKGKYDTRFTGKGFLEIAALSDTLNTAAIELGKVEGLRRELLANVSHDLRTPLTLIYSYAEMMNDFPNEITQEQTRVIMDETTRLTSLVNDILDISKQENEMEQLNISYFNLTQSIMEIMRSVEELLFSENFKIKFNHDGEAYVEADETKVGRVFYNLLINAVNYSADCRTIYITQTVSGNHVRISVMDGGEGITEDELPFIWDRYYKSTKKHKRAVTGSGLGLSIVKRIIDLHGGSYGVKSEISEGSTFWFEIGLKKETKSKNNSKNG